MYDDSYYRETFYTGLKTTTLSQLGKVIVLASGHIWTNDFDFSSPEVGGYDFPLFWRSCFRSFRRRKQIDITSNINTITSMTVITEKPEK